MRIVDLMADVIIQADSGGVAGAVREACLAAGVECSAVSLADSGTGIECSDMVLAEEEAAVSVVAARRGGWGLGP